MHSLASFQANNLCRVLTAALLLCAAGVALAQEPGPQSAYTTLSEQQWYGSLSASYSRTSGDIGFYGTTASAYGGTPSLDMSRGNSATLAFGFDVRPEWRLEGSYTYLSMRTDDDTAFGLGDRSDDTFAVDGQVDSMVWMLGGSRDMDLGSPYFTPYLRGGIGVAQNTSRRVSLDVDYNSTVWDGTALAGQQLDNHRFPEGTSVEFAWSLAVGARIKLSQRVDAFLEFGVLDVGDALTETDANGDALGFDNLMNRKFTLGFDYRF